MWCMYNDSTQELGQKHVTESEFILWIDDRSQRTKTLERIHLSIKWIYVSEISVEIAFHPTRASITNA